MSVLVIITQITIPFGYQVIVEDSTCCSESNMNACEVTIGLMSNEIQKEHFYETVYLIDPAIGHRIRVCGRDIKNAILFQFKRQLKKYRARNNIARLR
jgi:hypothetical protein